MKPKFYNLEALLLVLAIVRCNFLAMLCLALLLWQFLAILTCLRCMFDVIILSRDL